MFRTVAAGLGDLRHAEPLTESRRAPRHRCSEREIDLGATRAKGVDVDLQILVAHPIGISASNSQQRLPRRFPNAIVAPIAYVFYGRSGLRNLQRLVEIPQDVFQVLQAHGDANHVRADPRLDLLLVR